MRKRIIQNTQPVECPYCKGEGYFQLRLGGSETCGYCSGSGKNEVNRALNPPEQNQQIYEHSP